MLTNRHNVIAHWTTDAAPGPVALLLAGGDGTRLQDLTLEISGIPIPKQYCRLWHGSSLLESTLARAHLFAPPERIHIVVNQGHLRFAEEQLSAFPESNVLVQPMNHDTGPGIVFSLLRLQRRYSDAIVAVFPTDHFVDDDQAFIMHVARAADTVSRMPDKIAILGIVPDRPETGYGYILPSHQLEQSEKACYVEAFVEKPGLSSARKIVSHGALWNTFVMVFRISRMLDLVRKQVPHHFDRLSQLRQFPERASELYRTLEPWNFSTQVLSRIPEHLVVHEVEDVYWSDWGTRESVERTYKELNVIPFWNISNTAVHHIPG